MLDRIPSLISFFGAFILSASVVYDYWFFYMLGTNFSEMPTSLSDHLRSSLIWIPFALVLLCIALILAIFAVFRNQGMTKGGRIQKHSRSALDAASPFLFKYTPWVLALFPFIGLLSGVEITIQAWGTYLLFWWVWFSSFLQDKGILENKSIGFHLAGLLIPFCLIWIAQKGMYDAQDIRGGDGTQYVFDVGGTKIVGALARSFDKYFLVWDKGKEEIVLVNTSEVIKFYPQSEVDKSNSKEKEATVAKGE